MKKILMVVVLFTFSFCYISANPNVNDKLRMEIPNLAASPEHSPEKINCKIKVNSPGFEGTVTFHDVSILDCTIIKILNFFK
jgi:hypothetical protein